MHLLLLLLLLLRLLLLLLLVAVVVCRWKRGEVPSKQTLTRGPRCVRRRVLSRPAASTASQSAAPSQRARCARVSMGCLSASVFFCDSETFRTCFCFSAFFTPTSPPPHTPSNRFQREMLMGVAPPNRSRPGQPERPMKKRERTLVRDPLPASLPSSTQTHAHTDTHRYTHAHTNTHTITHTHTSTQSLNHSHTHTLPCAETHATVPQSAATRAPRRGPARGAGVCAVAHPHVGCGGAQGAGQGCDGAA